MKPKEKVMLAEILRLLRPKTLAQARLQLAYEMAGSTPGRAGTAAGLRRGRDRDRLARAVLPVTGWSPATSSP